MRFPSWLRKKKAAPTRPRPYRPVLDPLEDRFLLSAGFTQVNLSSDVPGLAPATDPNLINPWGLAYSPTGPFWFADNGSGVSDLLDGRGQPVPLVVTVPPPAGAGGTPTGTVFHAGAGFDISENGVSAPARFLFATRDGGIFGWSSLVDPGRALLAVDNSSGGAVYTGLTLAADPAGRSSLYAADFGRGTIDVFDPDFRPVVRPGAFRDPNLPDGYAPFNVQNVNNQLFVTYARRDADMRDDVPGAGHGFIDVYNTDGSLIRRIASGGALNSPWGLAQAPADFGPFGGALLVGNNGDGRINAYDPGTGAFLGELGDANGTPITVPGLWALKFGNGHAGGDSNTLFFTAGVGDEQHGLFGAIQAPGREGRDTAGSGAFDPNAPGEAGDYPLPPSAGPAFLTSSEDRPLPVSELLPLRESSLALVPTLSADPRPRVRPPVVPDPVGDTSMSGPGLKTISAPRTTMPALRDGDPQPVPAPHSDAVARHTLLLDLGAAQPSPYVNAEPQEPAPRLRALTASGSPWVAEAAGVEGLSAGGYTENAVPQPFLEQGPETQLSSGQASEVVAEAASESHPESAREGAAGNDRQAAGAWARLRDILIVLTIPVLWASWVWRGGIAPRKGRAGFLSKARSSEPRRVLVPGEPSPKNPPRSEPTGRAAPLVKCAGQ